jgi:hypothetical protein
MPIQAGEIVMWTTKKVVLASIIAIVGAVGIIMAGVPPLWVSTAIFAILVVAVWVNVFISLTAVEWIPLIAVSLILIMLLVTFPNVTDDLRQFIHNTYLFGALKVCMAIMVLSLVVSIYEHGKKDDDVEEIPEAV